MQVTWVREEGLATIQQAQRDSRVVAWDGFGQIISLQDLMRLEWRYIYILFESLCIGLKRTTTRVTSQAWTFCARNHFHNTKRNLWIWDCTKLQLLNPKITRRFSFGICFTICFVSIVRASADVLPRLPRPSTHPPPSSDVSHASGGPLQPTHAGGQALGGSVFGFRVPAGRAVRSHRADRAGAETEASMR